MVVVKVDFADLPRPPLSRSLPSHSLLSLLSPGEHRPREASGPVIMATSSYNRPHEAEHNEQVFQRRVHDYGGNPLAHVNTGDSVRLPAFGGAFQPGLYRPPSRNFGNPAPMGLAGFALTTFLLSCINLGVKDLASPPIVIGPAFAYGGLVQLLAGMWEIAVGNSRS